MHPSTRSNEDKRGKGPKADRRASQEVDRETPSFFASSLAVFSSSTPPKDKGHLGTEAEVDGRRGRMHWEERNSEEASKFKSIQTSIQSHRLASCSRVALRHLEAGETWSGYCREECLFACLFCFSCRLCFVLVVLVVLVPGCLCSRHSTHPTSRRASLLAARLAWSLLPLPRSLARLANSLHSSLFQAS